MDIVIGGSYHKFLKDINKLHDKLEKSGHRVLAPIRCARESKDFKEKKKKILLMYRTDLWKKYIMQMHLYMQ